MKDLKKLSRDAMKKVTGGLVNPNCFYGLACTVNGFSGQCDGVYTGPGTCGCAIGGQTYASPACSRGLD